MPLGDAIATDRHESRGVIRAIAVFRLLKALLLIGAGVGAFRMVDPQAAHALQHLLETIASNRFPNFVDNVIGRLTGLSPKRLEAVGVGAFAYAALFTVEGIGLWMGRRWAEYLTVIATTSLIPFEVYEIMKGATALKLGLLALNIAIVVYLTWRLRRVKE